MEGCVLGTGEDSRTSRSVQPTGNYVTKQDVGSALTEIKSARGRQKGESASSGRAGKVPLKRCHLS